MADSPADSVRRQESYARAVFEPLPPMPGLPDPTAVFITHEDTARELAESALAWVRRHSRRRRRNALRWVITAIVLYSLWSLGGLLIGLAICAALVGMYRRRWNSDPVRTVALFSAMAAPGTVMASRFGPAAFDIQVGADTHRRIHYDSIRDLEVTPAAVAFGEGPQYHTYPRELFPDSALELMTADTHPVEPPSPIPPLADPSAVYVVRPGDTSRLVRVPAHRFRVRRAIIFALLSSIYLITLYLIRGSGPVPLATAGILLLAVVFSLTYTADRNRREREMAHQFPPGTGFAARFGPDAADIHLGSRRTRIRYEWINEVRIEDGVVELRGLDGGAYPRELLPDFAIAYIRALNAEMAASR